MSTELTVTKIEFFKEESLYSVIIWSSDEKLYELRVKKQLTIHNLIYGLRESAKHFQNKLIYQKLLDENKPKCVCGLPYILHFDGDGSFNWSCDGYIPFDNVELAKAEGRA